METKELSSIWKGSAATLSNVAQQIAQRWGEEAVKEYDPKVNCFTFKGWQERGYHVKKGEKAIRSVTFIGGDKILLADGTERREGRGYPKNVCLFFHLQVERKVA